MSDPFTSTPTLRDRVGRPWQWVVERWHLAAERLPAAHRQYMALGGLLGAGVVLVWITLSLSAKPDVLPAKPSSPPSRVTHLGVMPPGQQVNPLDQWVGTAGRKLAQYENDRDEQQRLNRERQTFEGRTLQRFAELEQRVASTAAAASSAQAAPSVSPPAFPAPVPAPVQPAAPFPAPAHSAAPGLPPLPTLGSNTAMPPLPTLPAPELPRISHVRVSDRAAPASPSSTTGSISFTRSTAQQENQDADMAESSFLPVGFIRGTLLGGLDAPTGGQAQANPHPVLIRLSDNAVLPNGFRGEYRECFVVAAGYGDISSERAYLRTESLSCVRHDGSAMEVRIQGSVYGEDGKVGLRGRLVTKQGQMLANALLSGIVGGIGQGVSTSSGSYSQSPLGTVANMDGAQAMRAGMGNGVGRALDRLAQYYIKLAENTFPVIEIDAAREIDVVITKGVRIPSVNTPSSGLDAPASAAASPAAPSRPVAPSPLSPPAQEALYEGF